MTKQQTNTIKEEIKGTLNEHWDYFSDLLKDKNIKKEELYNYLQNMDLYDYENLAWCAGYIRGLEFLLNNN